MQTASARRYVVAGMSCGHCVAAVTEEVSAVPGVDTVAVDLDLRQLAVAGTGFSDDAIRAAVAEAGYHVDRRIA